MAAAGKRKEIPSGFDQAIPGILVMFTLLVLLTSGGSMLVFERNQGGADAWGEVAKLTEAQTYISQPPTIAVGRRRGLPHGGMWRRDRDSNPGWACTHNGFRDRPVRPLRHLSAGVGAEL